ncbi:unnamed protein product [Toxocara canis]|uniref:ZnMc domain-containing protein n=1 Tax=Toxocara canis TaxID=6265 RepID=A0A183UYG3_TOXCA|nr:unnamed protein product [Toxocara canis]
MLSVEISISCVLYKGLIFFVQLTAAACGDHGSMLKRDMTENVFVMVNVSTRVHRPLTMRTVLWRHKRQAFRDSHYPQTIWGDGPIPFTIDNALPQHAKSIVWKSVNFWRDNTCIDFEFNGRGRNSISFIRMPASCSVQKFRNQTLERAGMETLDAEAVHFDYLAHPKEGSRNALGDNFDGALLIGKGMLQQHWTRLFHTVTHELAHALGLFHTQSRFDRDQYVTIVAGNAQKDQRSNFIAETPRVSENYGIPYEYGSVMHYRYHE